MAKVSSVNMNPQAITPVSTFQEPASKLAS